MDNKKAFAEACIKYVPNDAFHFESGWRMWPNWFVTSSEDFKEGFRAREEFEMTKVRKQKNDIIRDINHNLKFELGQFVRLTPKADFSKHVKKQVFRIIGVTIKDTMRYYASDYVIASEEIRIERSTKLQKFHVQEKDLMPIEFVELFAYEGTDTKEIRCFSEYRHDSFKADGQKFVRKPEFDSKRWVTVKED